LGIPCKKQVGTVGTIFDSKENSMKWFKRMIVRWVQEDWDNASEPEASTVYPSTKNSRRNNLIGLVSDDVESDAGLNITVRKAIGGKIITFRHYDVKTDRSSNKLYIVPDELDFERELGKMITLESMRG
jgi:hypothetical protein